MIKLNKLDDTIAAISTPIGQGGIGIVRISGPEALQIADKIFLAARRKYSNKKAAKFKTYTINYGWIVENSKLKTQNLGLRNNNSVVDEVILSVMRAPKSYTREDVVEINCHSGIVNLRKILDLVLEAGARLAEPGEFTKRAFLNGRIDLAQAEAVLDIIQAKTEASLRLGIEQLKGRLSYQINNIRDRLLDVLANLEASIDFPEEDIETRSIKRLAREIVRARECLDKLIKNSSKGKLLREGIKVVIAGRPNVGKSSLLNALLEEERAIVTAIPGTTRDTIEEVINLGGMPLRFFDTAGILRPKDLIDKEAIRRTHQMISAAELILLVLDGSQRINKFDRVFIDEIRHKTKIIVINKIDLPQKIKIEGLKKLGIKEHIVRISALKHTGLEELENVILKKVWPGRLTATDEIIVSNARHIESLRKSLRSVKKANESINKGLSAELVSVDVKEAIEHLDAIIGRSLDRDLLDKIFSEFCIGK
jgi:tRNA modification GTPase